MTTIRTILSCAVLLLAAYIVVINWTCVIKSYRNKKRGIDRHHSMIPLMSAALAYVASLVFPYSRNEWMIIVPFFDPSIWSMLSLPFYLPFRLLRESHKQTPTEQDGGGNALEPPSHPSTAPSKTRATP